MTSHSQAIRNADATVHTTGHTDSSAGGHSFHTKYLPFFSPHAVQATLIQVVHSMLRTQMLDWPHPAHGKSLVKDLGTAGLGLWSWAGLSS